MEAKKIPPSPPFAKGGVEESPYPGLRPYREDEQDRFFGREADKAILVDKILGNRLTLLFAASGVGKSSLLQAAVIPHLKADAGENLSVVYSIDWVRDEHSTPLSRLHDAILKALREDGTLPADAHPEAGTLAELLEFCALFARTPLVLILDQFEEFFRYQRHTAAFRPFIEQLATVITDAALPVSVVISMREDYAMELNAFKPQLPTLLFENFYRLEKLNRKAAKQAILDPARQVGCDYEDELLERLLKDLQDRKREQAGLPHQVAPVQELEAVDPPYLQIVCAYLWKLKGADETTLRLANYDKAGGIDGILNYFLDDALNSLSSTEKQLASRAFDFLAAKRGIKMAYPLDVLASILRVQEAKLDKVLVKLARRDMNILRDQTRNGMVWYELYHDMFSSSIDNWNRVWKKRKMRRRKIIVGPLVVIALVLLNSLLWSLQNGLPLSYMLVNQKFRMMSWGMLPEPLPELVAIPLPKEGIRVGEFDKDFGEMADQTLKENGAFDQMNFGYPDNSAAISEAFVIGKYEVTYEQYDYYVWQQQDTENPPQYPVNPDNGSGQLVDSCTSWGGLLFDNSSGDSGRGVRAVVNVSWNDANAYLRWLSEKTGKYFRLPTETEWEYAARAETTTPYWWGDIVHGTTSYQLGGKVKVMALSNANANANCDGCGSLWDNKFVAPVGSFKPNPFGLYDTAGNAWEWTCSEWKAGFDGNESHCVNPSETSGSRVLRGGSWRVSADWVRSSVRSRGGTVNRANDVGFRVLRLSR